MRLTLRTLLAYLDDTLEPAEAKAIGQKVAESDAAKELIARIKEVTRRRRITSPAADAPGNHVDPNTIAGYLDNALSSEALGEVEQHALTSDVHLAEIAACHQILTVVLGEPAVVPPTAYKRMYGLVKPPESNPQHKPPVRREADDGLAEGREVDETLRLGMPALFGKGSWRNRLILIGGSACAAALLIVSFVVLLWGHGGNDEVAELGGAKGTAAKSHLPGLEGPNKTGVKIDQEKAPKQVGSGKDKPVPDKEKLPPEKDKLPPEKDKLPPEKDKLPPEKDKLPPEKGKLPPDEVPTTPNAAVVEVGQFEPVKNEEAVLLQLRPDKKQPEQKVWTRLMRTADKDSARVMSNTPLVSLPGYRSVVQHMSGAKLTLWGNVREISPFPLAVESLVTLHPSKDIDLDLTLMRGRIAVLNPKDQPLKMRLRFANPADPAKPELWEITLEKGSEIIVNLAGAMQPGEPFYPKKDKARVGPMAAVVVLVHVGSASIKREHLVKDNLLPPPQGPVVIWDSRGKLDTLSAAAMPPWVQPLPKDVDPKLRAAMENALIELSKELYPIDASLADKPIDARLLRAIASGDIEKRRLAVRCAGAIDDLARVIEALESKDLAIRQIAIETLELWIGAARDNDYVLFEKLQPTCTPEEAQVVMTLLHHWTPEQNKDVGIRTWLVNKLMDRKIAIRELAHAQLMTMPDLFEAGSKIGYNAVAPEDQRLRAAKQWQALVTSSGKQ